MCYPAVELRAVKFLTIHYDAVTFSLPKPTFAIIVLSQLDPRYFKEISGTSSWSLDFVLAKRGEKLPLAESASSLLYSRSVNLEMDLEAGEYIVYVSELEVALMDVLQ